MEQLLNLLYKVYGEENVDFIDYESYLLFTIRLKDFYISNNVEQKHLIQGMWVRFSIIVEDKLYKLSELEGSRSKQTHIEYERRYIHSHLYLACLDSCNFNSFCTGNGSFELQYISVKQGVDINRLEFFLMLLNHFLSYEDLTNPYCKIETVIPFTEDQSDNTTTSLLTNYIPLLETNSKSRSLQFNTDYSLKDNLHNHTLLISILDMDRNRLCYEYLGKRGYITGNVQAEHAPREFITFKGEKIFTELLPNPESIPVDNLPVYISSLFFHKISNTIKYVISKKLIQQHTNSTTGKALSDFFQGLPRQNQISFIKNL